MSNYFTLNLPLEIGIKLRKYCRQTEKPVGKTGAEIIENFLDENQIPEKSSEEKERINYGFYFKYFPEKR